MSQPTTLGHAAMPRTIDSSAITRSLREGLADFRARPTTAIVLIVVYPFIGLLLYRFAFDQALLPLLFPIVSGFALIGPIASAGLYEISRQRETGTTPDGVTAFRLLSRDRLIPLLQVGALLLAIYAAWIATAFVIHRATFGYYQPGSLMELGHRVFTTGEGWALLVVGCGVGFLFALLALAVGALSLPAIVDRGIGAGEAVTLSVRAFLANAGPMLLWGFVVAAGLAVGSLPFFLGLLIVLPVLGHATWHLYRKVVA